MELITTGETFDKIAQRVGGYISDVCIKCGGTGRTKEDPFHCDNCGMDYRPQTSQNDVTEAEICGVYIPRKYREEKNKWDLNSIRDQIVNRCHGAIPTNYAKFINRLNEIYDQVCFNNMDYINTQVIISADKNYLDILYIWAYSCIKAAYKNNMSTSNVINPIDFDIRDNDDMLLMEKDVLFVELTNMNLEDSISKIEYICMKRSKMDRNTYIITSIKDIRLARANMSISYDSVHKDEMDVVCNEASLVKIIKQG